MNVLAILILLNSASLAASIANTIGAAVSGLPGGVTINPACSTSATGESISVAGCVVYSTTNPVNQQPWSYTIGSESHATYTSIGASDSIGLVNADLTGTGETDSSGYASVSDALVNSLDPTDTIQFAFFLDGTTAGEIGLDYSRLVFSFIIPGYSTYQFIANDYDGWVVTPAYTVAALESGYRFSLSAQNLLTNPTSTSYNASGSVQFSNTLNLELLEPYTSSGTYVTNAAIGSLGIGGGFTFDTAPSVPEPSCWIMMRAGLIPTVSRMKSIRR